MYELIKPTFWQHIFGAGAAKLITNKKYERLSEKLKRRYSKIPEFPQLSVGLGRRQFQRDFYPGSTRDKEESNRRPYESDNSYTPPVFPSIDFDSGPSFSDHGSYDSGGSSSDSGGSFSDFGGGDGGGGGASGDY